MNPSFEYKKIIDRITDAFFIINDKGVFTYASDSVSRLLGHSPREIIGKNVLDFLHPEEHINAFENHQELLSYPGSRITHDYRISNSHQSYQWMEFIFVNMINIPQVAGIMIQMRDVEERKSAELLLQEHKEQFRLFMSRIPATVWIRDNEGRFVFVNEQFEASSGTKASEMLGKTYREVFPEDAQSVEDTDRLCRDFGKEIEYIESGTDKRGLTKDFVIYKFPIPRSDAKVFIGALGFDISRILKANEVIKEAEDKFKSIFYHAPDPIFIEDQDGIILDANIKACELQGIELQELRGTNILDITPVEKRSQVAEQFRKLWNGDLNAVTSFTWSFQGEEIPVEIHSSKTRHQGQEALILTLRQKG